MTDEIMIALMAFIGALVGGVCTLVANRKNISVQYITDKRVDWIYEVRNTLAEYIAIAQECATILASKKKVTKELYRELDGYLAKLRLLFNYAGEDDREILDVIEDIRKEISGRKNFDEGKLENDIVKLTQLSQRYLKMEWERVKYETTGKASARAGKRWKRKRGGRNTGNIGNKIAKKKEL